MLRCLLRFLFFACGFGYARRRAMWRRRNRGYWYD
jgi:hypothetical protein